MAMVAKTKENLNKCMCMKCPSYTYMCKVKAMPEMVIDKLKKDISTVEHMEAMFCAFGESKCIDAEKGCLCITCDVYKENGLDKAYYCMGGKTPEM